MGRSLRRVKRSKPKIIRKKKKKPFAKSKVPDEVKRTDRMIEEKLGGEYVFILVVIVWLSERNRNLAACGACQSIELMWLFVGWIGIRRSI